MRFGMGIRIAALLAALTLSLGPAPAAAAAAQAGAPIAVTPAFLIGRWTDNNNCSDAIDFHAGGRFSTTAGAQGRWSIEGDRIRFEGARVIIARIRALGADRVELTHSDGAIGHSTRCPGAATAGRRVMPALPATVDELVRISRPFTAAFLVGRWTDNGDCAQAIVFHADGRFEVPTGSGRWRLAGEQLTFTSQSEIRARARAVGSDRVLLVHADGTIGQSVRC